MNLWPASTRSAIFDFANSKSGGSIFLSSDWIALTKREPKGVKVFVTEDMVGHRLGEFSPTKKFMKHGGKMQKELEQKKKEAEITQAKSATTAAADAKKK